MTHLLVLNALWKIAVTNSTPPRTKNRHGRVRLAQFTCSFNHAVESRSKPGRIEMSAGHGVASMRFTLFGLLAVVTAAAIFLGMIVMKAPAETWMVVPLALLAIWRVHGRRRNGRSL